MKQILLILAVVVLVGCGTTSRVSDPVIMDDSTAKLKEENRTLKAENEKLRTELTKTKVNLKVAQVAEEVALGVIKEMGSNVAEMQSSVQAIIDNTTITDEGLKEVVIDDPIVRDALVKIFKKPFGKFAPPPKFTRAELARVINFDLSYTELTDAGLKDVAKLQNLTSLTLRIVTKITDAGLKEIAKLQNLTDLNLWHNTKITDAGLKDIAKLQKLKILNLIDTKITDACLKDLAKLQNLEWLYLLDTKITDEGAAELKKALPKCENFLHSYQPD